MSSPSDVGHAHSTAHHGGHGFAKLGITAIFLAIIGGILWYAGVFKSQPKVAIVTASQGQYWDLIVRGAQDAADKYHLRLTVVSPKSTDQTQAIRDLVGKGYDGIAISPNDPLNQAPTLVDVANDTNLITFDSDSPVSKRLCYVGTDNYDAGRTAGQQVKLAIPDGGDVIISIGSLDKQNAQRRRQGVIDELLDRSFEPARPGDPVDGAIKGTKYTIVATLVDGIDADKAQSMIGDAIKKDPNIKCIVGLFAYSAPAALKALDKAKQLDNIKVIGFDTNDETLAGIDAGHVFATMMQDPYYMGFEAMRILDDATVGDRRALPMFQIDKVGCDVVNKANLADARAELARKIKGDGSAETKMSPTSGS
jgi:ribose transport system substrate-binding protein